jgi:hypothetical protein
MAEAGEWVAVTAGFFLAIAASVAGLMVGVGFGLYLGEQVAAPLLPLSVLFGQVAAVVLTGFLVRRYRGLVKGVWIGGAITLIMAVSCAGYILSLG